MIVIMVMAVASTSAASAGCMDMAVCQLIFSRRANFCYFHCKVQVLAREGVVAVDSYYVAFNLGHAHSNWPVVSTGVELHAYLQVFYALKAIAGYLLLQCGVDIAIAIGRRDANCDIVPCLLALEGTFQARNDVAVPVEVSQRVARLGLIDDCATVFGECVIDRDDGSCFNLHVAVFGRFPIDD